MPSTMILGAPAGPNGTGGSLNNPVEADRAMLWDALGSRQGVLRGFGYTTVAAAMALDIAAKSAALVGERAGDGTASLERGYHVYTPEGAATRVTFAAASASARNDAVVAAFVDTEDGALGTGVTAVGPQIVTVTGVSGTTTPRTDADINAWIGRGGWVRLYDVAIPAGSTEISAANVVKDPNSWARNTGWVALTGFAAGWSARAGTYAPAYRRWADGRIDLRGGVQKSSAIVNAETVLTLPAEVRPAATVVATCGVSRVNGGPTARLDIATTGVTTLHFDTALTGGANWIGLDSIRYDLT